MEEDEDEGKEEERMEKEERNVSGSSPKHRLSLQDLLYLQKLHDKLVLTRSDAFALSQLLSLVHTHT